MEGITTECIPKVIKIKDAYFYALSSSTNKNTIEDLKQDLIGDKSIFSGVIRRHGDWHILYQRTSEKVAKFLMKTTPCYGKERPELYHARIEPPPKTLTEQDVEHFKKVMDGLDEEHKDENAVISYLPATGKLYKHPPSLEKEKPHSPDKKKFPYVKA